MTPKRRPSRRSSRRPRAWSVSQSPWNRKWINFVVIFPCLPLMSSLKYESSLFSSMTIELSSRNRPAVNASPSLQLVSSPPYSATRSITCPSFRTSSSILYSSPSIIRWKTSRSCLKPSLWWINNCSSKSRDISICLWWVPFWTQIMPKKYILWLVMMNSIGL